MKKRKWLALLCCLLLPVSALAVTEGEVEDAPMVDAQLDTWQTETSYLPDASYYGHGEPEPMWAESDTWVENEMDADGYYLSMTQNPRLTAGEIRRAKALLADFQAGKAAYAGESVLEKQENVIVGVYALDPADFDGERAYVILPGTCLTDEQLLSIIAAYDEMGLVFDPEGLNYRNCSRGGGIETTRFLTDDERVRYDYLAQCIRQGKLILPEGIVGTLRNPTLEPEYFCGMTDFSIKPYRAMTDEEMVALLVSIGTHDERGEIDHAAVEAKARNLLYETLRCPLSMELAHLTKEGVYTPLLFTADAKEDYDFTAPHRAWYGASFTYVTAEGVTVTASANFDKETDALYQLYIVHENPEREASILHSAQTATQEMIDAAIAQAEKTYGFAGLEWHTAWDEPIITNWGMCIPVRAVAAQDWLLTINVGCDDGLMHGLELTNGTLVEALPEQDWGPNG